jgi:phosphoribosylanthranilate isomerase
MAALPPVFRPGGLVKICGLREPDHAATAAAAGADLLGFVFARTRRQITPEQAARCIEAARATSGAAFVTVGLFVNETPENVNAIAARAGLDLAQLHGELDPSSLCRFDLPVVVSIRPRATDSLDSIRGSIADMMASPRPPIGFVVDGYHPTEHGGQGVRADWRIAAALAKEQSLLLAGGLDHENVAEAIRAVAPAGVDVSSGVETNGVKDVEKIRRFIDAARTAFADRRLS